MSLKELLPLFLFLSLIVACDSTLVFEENKMIDGESWNANNKLTFDLDITDTLSPCNIYINLRHRADYAYSNLFMFITTKRPDGKMSVDTVDCVLQDNEGKWLGNGSGGLKDNRLFFRSGVRFPVIGKYQFVFEQAMRETTLANIADVGIRVERME